MIPEFDEKGNLPSVGLIRPTIQEFEERFVVEADERKIRKEIFDGYIKYSNYLILLNMASIQWVNGSYTTKKPNPNDIDLVIHFNGMKIHHDKELQKHFKNLIDKKDMKLRYRCHPQFVLIYPQNEPDLYAYYILRYQHWLKWFSKDREGNAKGLIEFNLQRDNFKSESKDTGEVEYAQGI